MLALETLQVADHRRWLEALEEARGRVREAVHALGVAFTPLIERAAEIARRVAAWFHRLVEHLGPRPAPEGHYWRDGRLRRDHSFYRRRAKLRRAERARRGRS